MQWDPDNEVYGVFTGPYLLVRTEETFSEFHLRYDWWAVDIGLAERMPWVERITDIPRPADDVAAQLVINDEVDCTMGLSPALVEPVLEQEGGHVMFHTGLEAPYGYVDWWPVSMYINCLEAPYTDPAVRWALAYAVDQRQLVEVAWNGAGTHTATPFPNYPGLTQYMETPDFQAIIEEYDVLERNLDRVDELMTGAGFTKDADGFWVGADGTRPDTDVYGAVPIFADLAPVVSEMLRQAGFDSTHAAPPDVWTLKGNGQALLHFFGHGGSVADPYTTLDMYHSRWVRPTGETNAGGNRSRWGNEAYDAIVEEMSRTHPDETDKMQELFNQAMAIWYEELPEVPLVQWFHRIAMNTTYWTGWPNSDNPYNTAYWHITFPITLWNLEPTQ
jgi:peptide/nickel transport system substrate-binding protein